ncbi:hypothetical protein L6452_16677 [Arctium lappa]|uniref:Uncharacterized protein n=1 Tax=Arctium lappa TaxID=4217 RepID=A0ACB9C1I2_ARCLA|nr:hypothetical protein L6452_16677 [Arctium lappa]
MIREKSADAYINPNIHNYNFFLFTDQVEKAHICRLRQQVGRVLRDDSANPNFASNRRLSSFDRISSVAGEIFRKLHPQTLDLNSSKLRKTGDRKTELDVQ